MPGLTTAFAQGLAANRPAAAASNAGFMWLSTDTNGGTLYQSTGSAWVQLAAGVNPPASAMTSGTLAAARGGTGLDASAAANGALLIGNGTGLSLATLTAGTNVTITNSAGGISVASSAGGGPASFSWSTKTSAYTLSTTDTGILADATSGALTLTLPTAVGSTARYSIKKKDSSANAITIATTSSQTIDGATTLTLTSTGSTLDLISDGSNWDGAGGPRGQIGYAQITSNLTTTSTTAVDASGLSVSVTIGARPVQVTFFCYAMNNSGAAGSRSLISLVDSTAAATIQNAYFTEPASGNYYAVCCTARVAPAAGSRTYKVQYQSTDAGTTTLFAGSTSPAFLLVDEL